MSAWIFIKIVSNNLSKRFYTLFLELFLGRLEDLISTGEMSLKQCRFFILDEADGLLKSGYENLIKRLHEMVISIIDFETYIS